MAEPPTEPGPQPAGSTRQLTVALIAAALVQFTALYLLNHLMVRGNWGLTMGAATAAILPLGLILWFGVARRHDRGGWWKIPLVLWFAGFFALFPGTAVREDPSRPERPPVYLPVVADDYWRAGVRIAEGATIVAERPGARSTARPAHTDDMRIIERIGAEFRAQMEQDGRDYEAALAATGYTSLLGPTVRPADLQTQRRILVAVRRQIGLFETRYQTRIEEVERALEAAPISEESRATVLEGFRAAIGLTRDRARQIWQLEQDIASAQLGMIDILAQAQWRRDGARFVLSSALHQERFDARMSDVIAAREEQAAARQTMRGIIRTTAAGMPPEDEVGADEAD
jgi:hypothetical protein